MKNFNKKYFLGANSCEGFYSKFADSYNADEGWRAFLIKGGPGTGKSSFMKYIAAKAQRCGIDFELCICSSDPNSLDGIILPEKKTVVLDATSPHIVEPSYPAVCEEILNFGQFWDADKIVVNRKEVLEVTRKNKLLHKKASGYLLACGQLIYDNYKTALAVTDKEKALAFADKLCKKYIPNRKKKGKEWVRFIEGISPLGIISYKNTVTENYNNLVIISDNYGSASNIIINKVREYALEKGHEIITLKNPFLPSVITDHILIPELSLAFVTENDYMHFSSDERRIHARRFVNSTKLHNSRSRIFFNKKISKQLLLYAAQTLSQAKSVHDELEKYYIKAMDFKSLSIFAEEFFQKLFS